MPVYVTHFDKNFASRAAAMIHSLRTHGCRDLVIAICHDEMAMKIMLFQKIDNLRIYLLNEVERTYPELQIAKSNRNHLEYLFCLTPFVVDFAFSIMSDQIVVYVDADIYFFDSPDKALASLQPEDEVEIVPHHFKSNDPRSNKYGKYNVGWLAFRPSVESRKVLTWWRLKCYESTSTKLTNETYADQKYLDRFSTISTKVGFSTNLGHNAAPWNCYSVRMDANQNIIVGLDTLVYFHFSRLRMYPNIIVLGYARYRKRPGANIRKMIYQPYIDAIEKIESSLEFDSPPETRTFKIIVWVGTFLFHDFIIRSKPRRRRMQSQAF